jgi:hypothetical protein
VREIENFASLVHKVHPSVAAKSRDGGSPALTRPNPSMSRFRLRMLVMIEHPGYAERWIFARPSQR